MLNIIPPPALQGDEQAQLTQLYRYLFRLSEQLNVALNDTDKKMEIISTGGSINGGSGKDESADADFLQQYSTLKSMIVKTAHTVRSELEAVTKNLDGLFVAESEWGTYKEQMSLAVEETAKSTIESYKYGEQITDIKEQAASFDAYRIETEGYIKRGIIGRDDKGYPIIGIAIGQELKSTEVTIDGVVYQEFDTQQNMATYAADKLTFWIDGVEVAYLSNSELVVTDIIVSDSIKLGGWLLDANAASGLTIKQQIETGLDLSKNNTINITADKINAVADKIDLSGNKTIKLTAEQVNAVADEIDLSSNGSITLIAGKAERSSKTFRQEEYPDGTELVKPGDMLVNPSTGQQYQAVEAGEILFALDADGNLYYSYDSEGSLEMQGFDLYANGFAIYVGADEIGVPYNWELVQDSQIANTANDALSIANAAVSQEGFQRIIRFDEETGLSIGDSETEYDVLIDSASVNIRKNKVSTATFTDKYIRFGKMQVHVVSGGLAISVYKG